MEDTVMFRPAKRRKFLRQHTTKDDEDEQDPSQIEPPTEEDHPGHDTMSNELGISSVLRLRRQQKSRSGGVHFSNSRSVAATEDVADTTALMLAEPSPENLKGIADRFVGHSGQVVDVDRHMVAYIDSELAKRRNTAHALTATATTTTEQSQQPQSHRDHGCQSGNPSTSIQPSTRQPTSQGLLNEVEVEDKAPHSFVPPPPKPRKPRLDRFGRPLPPRKPRKGPASEDIARDKLVEDILNESGPLDVYQQPQRSLNTGGLKGERSATNNGNDKGGDDDDDGEDADSRLASQFQQEYLDAMQSRQQAQQQKKAVPGAEPGQKGPKLGGSRQQRAAMRERELKEEKEKAKGGGGA